MSGARVGSRAAFLLRPLWGLLIAILSVLGYLVPKNPRLWIFGNFKGFSDNSRYLFEHVRKSNPELRAVWLARSTAHRDEVRRAGYESELLTSYRGLLFAYRARVAVIQNGSRDLNRAALASQFVVQLWHGTPFKRILLDSNAESVSLPVVGPIMTSLGRAALAASLRATDMLVAPSPHVGSILASAFRIEEGKVAVTGVPRTDVILDSASVGSPSDSKRILVAPTWRRPGSETKGFVGLNPEAWNAMLDRVDAELVFKLHPLMAAEIDSYVAGLDPHRMRELPADLDINPLLSNFSALITDYSAIAFDFALLGRPIFFVCPDEREYMEEWGLYEPMEQLVGEALHRDYESLMPALERAVTLPGSYPREVIERLTSYRFLAHRDQQNCARICEEILRRLNEDG